jgi:thioredoxin reductase
MRAKAALYVRGRRGGYDVRVGRTDEALSRRAWLHAALLAPAAAGCAGARGASPVPPGRRQVMTCDVVIVGGGPAGLSAALALGRARKRVLVCDAGPRRNAAAAAVHNFLTRDGTPPAMLRRIGREQLAGYPQVELRDVGVAAIAGARGAFRVDLGADVVDARRVLLCTGMIDEPPPIPGLRELWGRAVFQCPYCHGWEVQDRRWGYLARAADAAHAVPFAVQARGWTREVTLFTGGGFEPPADGRAQLAAAGVRVETAPVTRLVGADGRLAAVELADGRAVACDVLYHHPPQRQVDVVAALGLALDDGYVRVDPARRETSIPGIHAAGDLTTRIQGAILAAAAGTQAAAVLNLELTLERAASGAL